MKREEALYFADQFRSAREVALKDSEAFDGIIHVVERLGQFLFPKGDTLTKYKIELEKLARDSDLAENIPGRFRHILTPFPHLYQLVKIARNDALHQGAFARHLTVHAVELALILEDVLRMQEKPIVSDYMVKNPVCAELWQPIAFIRQQMLAGSFSALPFRDKTGWRLLSDHEVAEHVRKPNTDRSNQMTQTLLDSGLGHKARCIRAEETLENTLQKIRRGPVLVVDKQKRLLGILTAFDLL
jgi:hypothetical protein